MHWDRKLTVFAAAALILVLAAGGLLAYFTFGSLGDGGERVRGNADEGFAMLTERLADPEQIAHVKINRRGKFESAEKYSGFNPAWLREMRQVPGEEFTEDAVEYTHTVELTLKTYDTEGKYTARDNPISYTRYQSSAMFYKNGELYYVCYREGRTEYHIALTCAPLTEWLDGITSVRLD